MMEQIVYPVQGFQGLMRYFWSILTTEHWFKGRLSRGEYRCTSFLVTAMTSLIGLLCSYVPVVGWIIVLIVSIVGLVCQIGLGIRRSHDLGFSGWYGYKPLIAIIVLGIVGVVTAFFMPDPVAGVTNVGETVSIILFALCFIILGIWTIVVSIKIAFFKGTIGANQYGEDRLTPQPQGDGWYWLIGIVLMTSMIIFDSLNPNTGFDTQSVQQFLPQDMGINMLLDGGLDQNLDVDMSLDEQSVSDYIDTQIQQADQEAQALLE